MIALFSLASCGTSHVQTKEELQSFVQDPKNGLIQEYKQGDFTIKVQYRPKDLIIYQQTVSGKESEIDSLRIALKDYEYFIFSISGAGKEIESYYMERNVSRYGALNQYLTMGLADDIQSRSDNTAVELHDAQYVPHYGSSRATSVLLVFKDLLDKNQDDIRVVFNDSFFGLGTTEFVFEGNKIRKIPQLYTPSFTL